MVFFFAEASIYLIAAAGVIVFVGQAFIQLLMLMFLADTIRIWPVEAGQAGMTASRSPSSLSSTR